MKKFILSVVAFSVLIVFVYKFISHITSPTNKINNDYMAGMIDKHDRIVQLNCPKIIFAGGSNLAFGLDSKKIEDEFSIPVVNLGLHAGLGLDFILNELKSKIEKDDVVFLSIEYFMGHEGNYELKRNTSKNYKEALNYYSFDWKAEIMDDIDKTRTNLKSEKESPLPRLKTEIEVYSRKAFNKYGDVVSHLEKQIPKELGDRGVMTYSYWSGIDELNEFYSYAKYKEVDVFFIYPNYPLTQFEVNQEVINKLAIDLSNNLRVEILNQPNDFVFPDSLFFDTVYHLNKKGREERTHKLIELIKGNRNVQKKMHTLRRLKESEKFAN